MRVEAVTDPVKGLSLRYVIEDVEVKWNVDKFVVTQIQRTKVADDSPEH